MMKRTILVATVAVTLAGSLAEPASPPWTMDLVPHESNCMRPEGCRPGTTEIAHRPDWMICNGPFSAGARPLSFSSGMSRAKWMHFLVVWQPYTLNTYIRLRSYRWVQVNGVWKTEHFTIGPEIKADRLGGYPIGHWDTGPWWNAQVDSGADWYVYADCKGDPATLYTVRLQAVFE